MLKWGRNGVEIPLLGSKNFRCIAEVEMRKIKRYWRNNKKTANQTVYRRIHNFKYKKAGFNERVCIYCGDWATVWDHVPPLIYATGYNTHIKYPSCRLCNGYLNAYNSTNIMERKEYLKEKYKQKYSKFLKIPDWDLWEFGHLDKKLSEYIKGSISIQKEIKNKIVCLNLKPEEM